VNFIGMAERDIFGRQPLRVTEPARSDKSLKPFNVDPGRRTGPFLAIINHIIWTYYYVIASPWAIVFERPALAAVLEVVLHLGGNGTLYVITSGFGRLFTRGYTGATVKGVMGSKPAACAAAPPLMCGSLTLSTADESTDAGADEEADPPLLLGELAPDAAPFDSLFLKSAITGRSGRACKENPSLDEYAHPECRGKFDARRPLCDGSCAHDLWRNSMDAAALDKTRLECGARLSS
jgi:hypothetical protein